VSWAWHGQLLPWISGSDAADFPLVPDEVIQFILDGAERRLRWGRPNDQDVEYKPLEYPSIFQRAGLAIIAEFDLAAVVESVGAAANRNLQAVRPNMDFFKLSGKTGEGMAGYRESLERWRTFSHTSAAVSK
jgi:hypothetical protein